MLKNLLRNGLLLLSMALLTNHLSAQSTASPEAMVTTRAKKAHADRPYKAADPTVRAQKMTDQLTKELGLDEATLKKVYDATLARAQKVDAIQSSSDDNKTKNKSLQANAADFKQTMQGILTPDQFAKFQTMKHHDGPRGHKPDAGTQQEN